MYVVKKFNIIKLAKLSAISSAIFGFIPALFGFIPFLFRLIGGYGYYSVFNYLPLFFIVAIPIGAGIAGFIYGLIIGFVYNQVAQRGYGLEIDLEIVEEKS